MKRIVTLIVSVIAFAIIFFFLYTTKLVSWDFRNNLWAPTYLIWHGESAYNINALFVDSNSIWFPQIIGLFFPLGLLSQYQAATIWLILNIVLILFIIWYSFRLGGSDKPNPLHIGVLILIVFLFPSTIRHLILGQVGILLTASIIIGTHAIERHQFTLGGFMFAIALVKPQQCILILPSVIVYLLLKRRVLQDTMKLIGATCFFSVLLTVPLWFSSSNWITDLLSNLQRNPIWAQPNLFSLLFNKFGIFGLIIWFILYLVILIISLQIWLKNKPTIAVLWSLALTTFISPYLWSWDFVLLLPLLVNTAIKLSNVISRLILFIFYVTSFVLSVITLQIADATDVVLWWLPFTLMVGIIVSLIIDQRNNVHEKSIPTIH